MTNINITSVSSSTSIKTVILWTWMFVLRNLHMAGVLRSKIKATIPRVCLKLENRWSTAPKVHIANNLLLVKWSCYTMSSVDVHNLIDWLIDWLHMIFLLSCELFFLYWVMYCAAIYLFTKCMTGWLFNILLNWKISRYLIASLCQTVVFYNYTCLKQRVESKVHS